MRISFESARVSNILDRITRIGQRLLTRLRSGTRLTEPHLSALYEQSLSGDRAVRLRQLSTAWLEAGELFKWGHFQESASMRTEVLEELYFIQTDGDTNHWPSGLSYEFGTNIGHHAISLLCAAAAKEGELGPKTSLILPVNARHKSDPLLSIAQPEIALVQSNVGASFSELTTQWHIFQRLQNLRTVRGFEELYHFMDRFLKISLDDGRGIFRLPENVYDYAISKLRNEYGLPLDAWYVGLHVRDDGSGPGRRNQPIESYLPAIKEVVARGGWVLRIGDANMRALPPTKNVIDLVALKEFSKEIHSFVLATSKAFIGTQSGPSSVPPLFGVATLVTNSTSIGRNTLPAGPGSIYLPKTLHPIDRSGETLSFRDQLATPDAFGELSLRELASLGFRLKNNSSSAILEAVRELLGEEASLDSAYSRQVAEIRKEVPFASQGEISHSFLESQKGWLD